MKNIEDIIDETPYINELQKIFYKTMLRERKERILDFSFNKLKNNYVLLIYLKKDFPYFIIFKFVQIYRKSLF